MKKIILVLFLFFVIPSISFALDFDKDYYISQITDKKYPYNHTGFFAAIQKQDIKTVELFLKSGFDPNATYMGVNAVIYSMIDEQEDILKLVLKYGANPNKTVPPLMVTFKRTNPLFYSITKNNPDMTKILIDCGADVNKPLGSKTPLYYALIKKHPEQIELLLSNGAITDEKTAKKLKKLKDEKIKALFKNLNPPQN